MLQDNQINSKLTKNLVIETVTFYPATYTYKHTFFLHMAFFKLQYSYIYTIIYFPYSSLQVFEHSFTQHNLLHHCITQCMSFRHLSLGVHLAVVQPKIVDFTIAAANETCHELIDILHKLVIKNTINMPCNYYMLSKRLVVCFINCIKEFNMFLTIFLEFEDQIINTCYTLLHFNITDIFKVNVANQLSTFSFIVHFKMYSDHLFVVIHSSNQSQ